MATQAQLDEARAAYHALMTGRSVVEIRHETEGYMRYTPTKAGELLAYIASLETQLGVPAMLRTGPQRTRGRRVLFG